MEEEDSKQHDQAGGDATPQPPPPPIDHHHHPPSSAFPNYPPSHHPPHHHHHHEIPFAAGSLPLHVVAPSSCLMSSDSPSSKRGKYGPALSPPGSSSGPSSAASASSFSQSSSPSAQPSLPPQPLPPPFVSLLPPQQQRYNQSSSQVATSSLSPSHSPSHSRVLVIPASSSALSRDRADLEDAPLIAHNPLSSTSGAHNLPFRKGKFVSPVWKPLEMLALARAWRIQYCGDPSKASSGECVGGDSSTAFVIPHKAKTRADKDWEVGEYLKQQGVQRDAKTAATKWDNMLGDFRRVLEWEKGPERDEVGKSYFRLTPQERKQYRLPPSFDEDVYEEMVQFIGHKPRLQSQRGSGSGTGQAGSEYPKLKDILGQEPTSGAIVQYKPLSMAEMEMWKESSALQIGRGEHSGSQSTPSQRIGKIKMVWEESVHIWGEEGGEARQGRLKLESLNFLHADQLSFLDENFAGNTIEGFEHGPLEGFSSDIFTCGQQLKVFGRRKHGSGSSQSYMPVAPAAAPCAVQDRTSYFLGCLKTQPSGLPNLSELISRFKEPPPQDWRFPLRTDVYLDLPEGKEAFFLASSEVDCREIIYEIVGPLIRFSNLGSSREFLISLWDDCINRVVRYFCAEDLELIRNSSADSSEGDERASMCGLIRRLCLWRGEEKGLLLATSSDNPSVRLVSKLLWTYGELPYILGYYAMGTRVTFCALSRDQDKVMCTNLATLSLSNPTERLRALTPCWHVAQLLPVLVDLCSKLRNVHSDYERMHRPDGKVVEVMFSQVKKSFPNRRRWGIVKEIYDLLQDHRVPFVEYVYKAEEHELALTFRPRGHPIRPNTTQQLLEALKCVCTALIALHNLSIMHRDVCWDNVLKRSDGEGWFLIDFEDSVEAPQLYPHIKTNTNTNMNTDTDTDAASSQAPEMSRGYHGLKVDVWGVGYLIKSSSLYLVEPLKDLQRRCMDHDPDQRPAVGDCFFHLVQLESSLKHY